MVAACSEDASRLEAPLSLNDPGPFPRCFLIDPLADLPVLGKTRFLDVRSLELVRAPGHHVRCGNDAFDGFTALGAFGKQFIVDLLQHGKTCSAKFTMSAAGKSIFVKWHRFNLKLHT